MRDIHQYFHRPEQTEPVRERGSENPGGEDSQQDGNLNRREFNPFQRVFHRYLRECPEFLFHGFFLVFCWLCVLRLLFFETAPEFLEAFYLGAYPVYPLFKIFAVRFRRVSAGLFLKPVQVGFPKKYPVLKLYGGFRRVYGRAVFGLLQHKSGPVFVFNAAYAVPVFVSQVLYELCRLLGLFLNGSVFVFKALYEVGAFVRTARYPFQFPAFGLVNKLALYGVVDEYVGAAEYLRGLDSAPEIPRSAFARGLKHLAGMRNAFRVNGLHLPRMFSRIVEFPGRPPKIGRIVVGGIAVDVVNLHASAVFVWMKRHAHGASDVYKPVSFSGLGVCKQIRVVAYAELPELLSVLVQLSVVVNVYRCVFVLDSDFHS